MGNVVAEMLRDSRAAHDRYRSLAGRVAKDGTVAARPNYVAAEENVREALNLRVAAHRIDPQHADPEWGNDKAPHATLVDFYVKWLRTP